MGRVGSGDEHAIVRERIVTTTGVSPREDASHLPKLLLDMNDYDTEANHDVGAIHSLAMSQAMAFQNAANNESAGSVDQQSNTWQVPRLSGE